MAATTPRKKKPKPTLDALLDGAKRAEKSIDLCLRPDLQADFEEKEQQLQAASQAKRQMLTDGAEAQRLAAEMQALREEMADAVVTFRLRALPPRRWQALMAEHPSSKSGERFNADTFGPAMIRACLIEPAVTDVQWAKLLGGTAEGVDYDGSLSSGQFTKLSDGAWLLNTEAAALPFSLLASQLTRNSAPN